jgi:hypothetical protein
VALARYGEAISNSWDKNDPKDAAVILEMLRRGDVQSYVDPMVVGTHDLQELAKTYYQVSRARTKVQRSLINHGRDENSRGRSLFIRHSGNSQHNKRNVASLAMFPSGFRHKWTSQAATQFRRALFFSE